MKLGAGSVTYGRRGRIAGVQYCGAKIRSTENVRDAIKTRPSEVLMSRSVVLPHAISGSGFEKKKKTIDQRGKSEIYVDRIEVY